MTFGRVFLVFQLNFSDFGLSLLFLCFCLKKSDVGKLKHFRITLRSLDNLCKIRPMKIRIISEAKKK